MLTKAKIAGLMVALMALSVPMVYADNGGGIKILGIRVVIGNMVKWII